MGRSAAAAIVLAVVVLGGVAVLQDPPDRPVAGPGSPSPAAAPPSEVPGSLAASTVPKLSPAWAANLLGQLECDGPPQAIGYERGFGPRVGGEGTASPYPWLEGLQGLDLPWTGWEEHPRTSWENGASHFVRYVNLVEGRAKAIVLMEGASVDGGPGSWHITAYRACRPVEFDPARARTTDDDPWRDERGAVTSEVRTAVGPAHCGWESSTWLSFREALFLRDPLGLFDDVTVGSYDPNVEAERPPTMTRTGLRSSRWELFLAGDPDAVYVRGDGRGLERWPRSRDPFIGCF